MKLYTFDFAPNPRRLMYFLKYKEITLDTEEISLRDRQQFSERFQAINPSCTVPALQLDDGTVLDDVIAICVYLESLYPERPLLGATPLETAKIIGWDHKIYVEGLGAAAEMVRNQGDFFENRAVPGLIEIPQIPDLVGRGQKRLTAFFERIEKHLSGREFMVGDTLSFADIDLYIVVYFAGWVKQSIPADCAAILAWQKRVAVLLGDAGDA